MPPTSDDADRNQVKNLLSQNVSVNLLSKLLYMATRICLPPIILSYLSMEEYGIWATCFIVIGYLGMSAFGVSNVYVRYVAEYHAHGRTEQISRLLSTGLITSTTLSAALLGVLWLLLPFVIGLLKIPPGLEDQAQVVIFAAAAVFMLDLSLGSFAYVLHGLQRIALQNGVWIVTFLLEGGLIIAFLHQGLGLYALLYAFVIRYILATILHLVFCYRAIPGLSLRVALFDREMLRLFYSYGGVVQLSGILGTFLYSIEKLLAGAFVGIRGTGLLDIGEKLPIMTSQIFMSMNTAFMPAMSHLGSTGHSEDIAKLVLKGSRYTHMATGLAMGYLAAFAAPLLAAWLGPRDDMAMLALAMAVFCIPFQIHILTGPASAYHRGVGNPARELHYKLVQGLLVAVTVGGGFQVVGPTLEVIIAGVAFSMVASSLLYIYYSNRFLQISAGRFTWEAVVPGLVPYATAFLLASVTRPWLEALAGQRLPLLGLLAACGLAYAAVTAPVLFFGFCSWGERQYLTKQLAHTLRSSLSRRGRGPDA